MLEHYEGQKRELDSLEFAFCMVVSHHMGAGNSTSIHLGYESLPLAWSLTIKAPLAASELHLRPLPPCWDKKCSPSAVKASILQSELSLTLTRAF